MVSPRRESELVGHIPSHSFVAEVVGPAGAGKSTLLKALTQREPRIVSSVQLPKRAYVPILIRHAIAFSPTFLRHYRHSRWFTWGETRSMVYLRGWHHALERTAPESESLTILDQGPIFRLAGLREFGPDFIKSDVYTSWWNSMLERWAATLNLVIWLDAPDAVLLQRVNSRVEAHRVKGRSELDAFSFFERYRTAYQQVIEKMVSADGPKLIRVNTHENAVEDIVDRVLIEVG